MGCSQSVPLQHSVAPLAAGGPPASHNTKNVVPSGTKPRGETDGVVEAGGDGARPAQPPSRKSSECAVTLEFLQHFLETKVPDKSWPTHRVVRDVVQPETASARTRWVPDSPLCPGLLLQTPNDAHHYADRAIHNQMAVASRCGASRASTVLI